MKSNVNCQMSNVQRGFTLIEILIVIAILAGIFSLGLFVAFDFYKSYAFRAEKNVIVSILQKARDQSLNNIDQVPHGVHFEPDTSNPTKVASYTIFEGSTYDSSNANNLVIGASYGVFITSPTMPFAVKFDQLSGSCNNCSTPIDIKVTANTQKSYDITINSEGQIDVP